MVHHSHLKHYLRHCPSVKYLPQCFHSHPHQIIPLVLLEGEQNLKKHHLGQAHQHYLIKYLFVQVIENYCPIQLYQNRLEQVAHHLSCLPKQNRLPHFPQYQQQYLAIQYHRHLYLSDFELRQFHLIHYQRLVHLKKWLEH